MDHQTVGLTHAIIITMHVLYLAMVINVEVEEASAGTVRVSWDSLDIPEITGYIVYYSQTGNTQTRNVTTSTNSVVIDGLMNNVEYQFQVAAIAEQDGDLILGERSTLINMVAITPTTQPSSPPSPTPSSQGKLPLLIRSKTCVV